MLIRITGGTTLAEIIEEFTHRFPNLKLEFFTDKNKDGILTADEIVKNHETKVGDIREMGHNGILEIDSLTTTADLEKSFFDVFGLYAQVFRKSGTGWLVTTTTDHLTLGEQNNMSGQMSKSVEPTETTDYEDLRDLE